MTPAWENLCGQASARGLRTLVAVMKRFAQPGAFDPQVTMDNRLVAPPNLDLADLVGQLVRRGLDPQLVRAMLPLLANRPLELGLFAWDVLTGAILPTGDPLVDELRAAARPLAPVLPAPGQRGIDLNQHSSLALVSRFGGMDALEPASVVELLAYGYEQRLAAFGELKRRGDDFVTDHDVHVGIHAFARVLHLAHLPSLAAVYLDFLSRALGYRPAAFDLCETLFDAEVPEHIPADALAPGDRPEAELSDTAEYLVYRAHLAQRQTAFAHQLFEQNWAQRPAQLPPPSARLVVMRAHLTTLMRKPAVVPLEQVSRVCEKERLWRYAARVRVAVSAAQSPAESRKPLQLLHDYITGFGNDRRCWHEALVSAPANAIWKRDAARVLGREATYLPHERAVWDVLSMFLTDPRTIQAVVDEIDARLRAQSTL